MKRITIATAAAVALMLTFGGQMSPLSAHPTSRQELVRAAATQAVQPQAPAKFDGHLLYQKAYEAFRDYHFELADPATRAKWEAVWQHKFDNTGDLNTPEGTDKAIALMRESLGQRFDYSFDDKETKAENDEVASQLVGIGATMKLNDVAGIIKSLPKGATVADFEKALIVGPGHELTVGEAIEGGPASKVLKAGDEIEKVDGKPIAGMMESDVIAHIKGAAGTKVSVTVLRADGKGGKQELTFSITRAVVHVPVVHTKDMGNGITYIKLDNFMSNTSVQEMAKALDAAGQGKGIILDLRGNPGGNLEYVELMATMMIPEGTILVTQERSGDTILEHQVIAERDFILSVGPDDKDPSKTSIDAGKRPPLLVPETMPIVVLVDEGSASASEILSGTLQANHRATIVGEPTVGKGVGQTVIDLPYNRRLHVTSFHFLPGGQKMDWIGIIPNIEVKQADDDGKTDAQLDAAVKEVTRQIGVEAGRETEAQKLDQANHDKFNEELKHLHDQQK